MREASPRPSPVLQRERLSAAIEERLRPGGVTLLRAAAGFGKSIVLEAFARDRPEAVVRPRIGADDAVHDLVRALFAAARGTAPARGTPLVQASRDLAAVLRSERATVVLDVSWLGRDAPAARFIAETVAGTRGSAVGWLIAARPDAALPVADWCAGGMIDSPLDELELAFDDEELRRLALAFGVAGEDAVLEIASQTSGWPAAVVAALVARRDAANSEVGRLAARTVVGDLFRRQVVTALTPAEHELLLETCFEERLDPAIVAAIAPDAAAVFGGLRRRQPLVGVDHGAYFRVNPFVRGCLLDELRSRGVEKYDGLRLRSAERRLFGPVPAPPVGPASERFGMSAAELLAVCGQRLVDCGETVLVHEALDELSDATRAADPNAVALTAQVGGRGDGASAVAAALSAARTAPSPATRAYLTLSGATALARGGEMAEAAERLGDVDAATVDDPGLRARLLATRAAYAARSAPVDACDLSEALAIVDDSRDLVTRAIVYYRAGQVALLADRLDVATGYASIALDAALAAGSARVALRARALLFRVARERSRWGCAQLHLRTISDEASSRDDLEMLLFGLCASSDIAAESGDAVWLDQLDAALSTAGGTGSRTYIEELGTSLGDALVSSRALRRSWAGEFAQALDLVASAHPGDVARAAAEALYAAAAAQREPSLDASARCLAGLAARPAGSSPTLVVAELLLALAALLLDDITGYERGVAALEARAETIALPYVRFLRAVRAVGDYVRNRTSRRRLTDATEALRRGGLGGYARLIEALPIKANAFVAARFTGGEVRILELLCAGLTSRQIAARLGRSILTVDSHVKTIVRKLHCSGGRREAIALARSGRLEAFSDRQEAL